MLKDLRPGHITTLSGPGGMGKTAIAAEVVRRLCAADPAAPPADYPDGILFHTFYGQADPETAFAHFVKSFDPAATDLSKDAASTALGGKRALVVLDGAEDAADLRAVTDVLPPTCAALVTTRTPGGLRLEKFSPAEAIALLQTLAARPELAEGPDICAKLDYFPLAVELAGKYMAQGESPAGYLNWLNDTPLDALHHGAHRRDSVPVLVEKSLVAAGETARGALAVAGLLTLNPFTREAIAAALPDPRRALDVLVRYGLLRRADGFYAVSHALIYQYARRRLTPPAEALPALADFYTNFTETEREKGLAGYRVLDAHRAHILQLIDACAAAGDWQHANALVWAVEDYLDRQGYTTDRVRVLETGVTAAQKLGDRQNEGAHLGNLGIAYAQLGQVERAIEYHQQALSIAREIGDRRGEGNQLCNLGLAYRALGQVERAIEFYEQALAIAREIGNRRSEGTALGNLGMAYAALGQVERAIGFYEQALAIAREIGDRRGEGTWLGNLGLVYADLGQVKRAIEYHEQALAIARDIGDRRGEGARLGNLGLAYSALGQVERAIEFFEQALDIQQEIGDRRGEGALLGYLGLEQRDNEEVNYSNALNIATEIKDPIQEALWNLALGVPKGENGDIQAEIDYYEHALTVIRQKTDNPVIEAIVLALLGSAYGDLANTDLAKHYLQQSKNILEKLDGLSVGNMTALEVVNSWLENGLE